MKYTYLLTLLLAFFGTYATAQVGVNNNDPVQTLDVGGKVKIADDGTAPTAGTLRYNAAEGEFEGHDGTQWTPLTGTNSSGPSNPVGYHGRTTGVGKGETQTVSFRPWDSGSNFTVVPPGKYFLITYLEYHANGLGADDLLIKAFIYHRNTGNAIVNTLTFDGPASTITPRIASRDNPIFVLREGEYLQLNHVSTSAKNFIELRARGFLVDDLKF